MEATSFCSRGSALHAILTQLDMPVCHVSTSALGISAADALQSEAFFPHDYPDTLAYSQLAAELAAEQDAQRICRPKGRRPEGTPHPPRWDLLGTSMTKSAGCSEAYSLKAPRAAANPEEHQDVITPAVGLPSSHLQKQCASSAAGEVQNAVLEQGHVLVPAPSEEPAAMDTDGPEHSSSARDAQAFPDPSDHSAPASLYVARTQRLLQRCLQHRPQQHCGYQQSSQEPVTVAIAESGPERSAGLGGSTGAGARCLVQVSLQTLGPGVPHEGAEILSLSTEEAANIRRSMLGHKLHAKVLTSRLLLLWSQNSGVLEQAKVSMCAAGCVCICIYGAIKKYTLGFCGTAAMHGMYVLGLS